MHHQQLAIVDEKRDEKPIADDTCTFQNNRQITPPPQKKKAQVTYIIVIRHLRAKTPTCTCIKCRLIVLNWRQ